MPKDAKPIIVKRVKRVTEGHHGGAWKVAYADFVTAMMAFFLMMWLLSTTTEDTRKALAEYFAPSVAMPATTTGGDGPFGGSSMFSEDRYSDDRLYRPRDRQAEAAIPDRSLSEIADELLGNTGDAEAADPLLRHIRTRLTDEGLIIEVFDIEGSPLFDADSAEPFPVLERLVGMIGRVIAKTANPVAVTGHLGTAGGADPWVLSADRAQAVRRMLDAAGVEGERMARVTGKADREHAEADAADPRNRRVEITLLRRFPLADPAASGR